MTLPNWENIIVPEIWLTRGELLKLYPPINRQKETYMSEPTKIRYEVLRWLHTKIFKKELFASENKVIKILS